MRISPVCFLKAIPAIDGSAFPGFEGNLRLLSAGRAGYGKQLPFRTPSARRARASARRLASVVFSVGTAILAARRLIVSFFREKILLVSPEDKTPATVLAYNCQIFSGHFMILTFANIILFITYAEIVPLIFSSVNTLNLLFNHTSANFNMPRRFR